MTRPVPLNPMSEPPQSGQVVWVTVSLSPSPANIFRVQCIYQNGQYYAVQDQAAGPIPGNYLGWIASN